MKCVCFCEIFCAKRKSSALLFVSKILNLISDINISVCLPDISTLRCVIPECDNEEHPRYEVDWVDNVIPSTNSKRSKCHRYQQYPVNSSQNFYNYDQVIFDESRVEFCNKLHSAESQIVRCDQDGLVYKTDEVSIVNEVMQLLNMEAVLILTNLFTFLW